MSMTGLSLPQQRFQAQAKPPATFAATPSFAPTTDSVTLTSGPSAPQPPQFGGRIRNVLTGGGMLLAALGLGGGTIHYSPQLEGHPSAARVGVTSLVEKAQEIEEEGGFSESVDAETARNDLTELVTILTRDYLSQSDAYNLDNIWQALGQAYPEIINDPANAQILADSLEIAQGLVNQNAKTFKDTDSLKLFTQTVIATVFEQNPELAAKYDAVGLTQETLIQIAEREADKLYLDVKHEKSLDAGRAGITAVAIFFTLILGGAGVIKTLDGPKQEAQPENEDSVLRHP